PRKLLNRAVSRAPGALHPWFDFSRTYHVRGIILLLRPRNRFLKDRRVRTAEGAWKVPSLIFPLGQPLSAPL
ncbi:MAG TPA: hypothetical protein VFJ88_02560, partial [Chthoniobacterales bacterium]|nr:hypothetical protein [Chthoniobacterales bacterium]